MSEPAAVRWPDKGVSGNTARALVVGACLCTLAALVPPVATEAARSAWAEALQFSLLAFPAPALLALGAPWRRSASLTRLAARRHPGRSLHGIPAVALFAAVVIIWRIPAAVDAIASSQPVALAEAASFLVAGVVLWLQLVPSPPIVPSLSRPERMVVAAVAMWVTWIVAYLLGFSHVSWFRAYHHVAGHGLSLTADQSLATGILWLGAAVGMAPVVFYNLITWLKHDEDPDEEMSRLLRTEERRRRLGGMG